MPLFSRVDKADAFESAKAAQKEGSGVVVTDIAGAGFEHLSPTLAYRLIETVALP